jgi:OOP family OmpA-OmpF porin
MKWLRNTAALTVAVAVAAGCATTPTLSRDQVLQEDRELAQIAQALMVADHNDVDVLAPAGYKEARSTFDRAVAAAQHHRTQETKATAAEAQKALRTAEGNAQISRDVMREVLAVRDRARAAGAPTLFADKYQAIDVRLHDAVHLVELGRIETAKDRRAALIHDYSDLELQSIKKGSVQAAQATLKRVKERDAAKYAPRTLKLAEEKMALALSILEADRTRQVEANSEAAAAIWHAERAAQISELIKDFERRDFSDEDKVLWYQDQLSEVDAPLGGNLPFNQENRSVILDMQGAIAALVAQEKQAKSTIAERDQQIAALKAQLQHEIAAASERLTDAERRQREYQARFDQVQALFDPTEATVYRQGANVLIVVHGFHFPTGESLIAAENFALMNKIQRAIQTFPGCKVLVTGHTDATGEPDFNLKLSRDRAYKVAKFLHDVGGIESARLTSEGFGDTKPVATNKTPEGRAENRRVELLLINSN